MSSLIPFKTKSSMDKNNREFMVTPSITYDSTTIPLLNYQ